MVHQTIVQNTDNYAYAAILNKSEEAILQTSILHLLHDANKEKAEQETV